MMKISNMYRSKKEGTLRAWFSVETEQIEIRKFKLMANDKGELWAAPPSESYQDKDGKKKWEHIVRIKDKKLLDKITDMARAEYFQENQPDNQSDEPF